MKTLTLDVHRNLASHQIYNLMWVRNAWENKEEDRVYKVALTVLGASSLGRYTSQFTAIAWFKIYTLFPMVEFFVVKNSHSHCLFGVEKEMSMYPV